MKIQLIATLMFSALLFAGCNDNQPKSEEPTEFDLLLDGKTLIENNASIESTAINVITGAVECNILVRNNISKDISMTVSKELIDGGGIANAAAINLFCWGICVGADVNKVTASVPAGPSICKDPFFTGDINVTGLAIGTKIKVRYIFTNDATKFSRTVNVTYSYVK